MMEDLSPLQYFKSAVLWNVVTNNDSNAKGIANPLLSLDTLSDKISGFHDLLDDTISGYRLYRKPGAFVDDFTLEKGCWTKDDYLHDWTYNAIFNQLNTKKAADRIIRSLHYYVQETGLDLNEVLDELWSEYWIIDVEVYSYIRKQIKYGDFAPPIEDIEDLYIDVIEKISSAKNDAKDMDDWLDSLHKIIPLVVYGKELSEFEDEEAKRYNRYFEEARADIIAVFSICLYGAIIDDDYFFLWDYMPKKDDEKKFNQELKYNYKSRVSIPKYWYEIAKACYNNTSAIMLVADALSKFDIFNLVGMFSHLSCFHLKNSLQYAVTGEPPQVENGQIFIQE